MRMFIIDKDIFRMYICMEKIVMENLSEKDLNFVFS